MVRGEHHPEVDHPISVEQSAELFLAELVVAYVVLPEVHHHADLHLCDHEVHHYGDLEPSKPGGH
jgi:hypothetical protein